VANAHTASKLPSRKSASPASAPTENPIHNERPNSPMARPRRSGGASSIARIVPAMAMRPSAAPTTSRARISQGTPERHEEQRARNDGGNEAADEHRTRTVLVGEAPGQWPREQRRHGEDAEHHASGELAAADRPGHVARQDRQDHSDREEPGERRERDARRRRHVWPRHRQIWPPAASMYRRVKSIDCSMWRVIVLRAASTSPAS